MPDEPQPERRPLRGRVVRENWDGGSKCTVVYIEGVGVIHFPHYDVDHVFMGTPEDDPDKTYAKIKRLIGSGKSTDGFYELGREVDIPADFPGQIAAYEKARDTLRMEQTRLRRAIGGGLPSL